MENKYGIVGVAHVGLPDLKKLCRHIMKKQGKKWHFYR